MIWKCSVDLMGYDHITGDLTNFRVRYMWSWKDLSLNSYVNLVVL